MEIKEITKIIDNYQFPELPKYPDPNRVKYGERTTVNNILTYCPQSGYYFYTYIDIWGGEYISKYGIIRTNDETYINFLRVNDYINFVYEMNNKVLLKLIKSIYLDAECLCNKTYSESDIIDKDLNVLQLDIMDLSLIEVTLNLGLNKDNYLFNKSNKDFIKIEEDSGLLKCKNFIYFISDNDLFRFVDRLNKTLIKL